MQQQKQQWTTAAVFCQFSEVNLCVTAQKPHGRIHYM